LFKELISYICILIDKNKSMIKYNLPDFLVGVISRAIYAKWLDRKATNIHKRDKKRFADLERTRAEFKESIHKAIFLSNGLDFYTGEKLAWEKISQYNNEKSEQLKVEYKYELRFLPTVDHFGKNPNELVFKICGWRTNDSKSDLSYTEYVELCKKVVNMSNKRTSTKKN